MRIFTNGCFDILHSQHLVLLDYCKQLAGKDGQVIVGLNSDKSIKSLKGSGRPINSQASRLYVLSSLKQVNKVIIFDEDTPYKLIYDLLPQPDAIVKGHDWQGKEVVGYDLMPEGQVFFAPTNDSITTSKIIERCYNHWHDTLQFVST